MRLEDLNTYAEVTWCPGCSNFLIDRAIKEALIELSEEQKIDLNKVVVLSGIGCHAKISDYINLCSFYSLHGRVPSVASGIKLANPELVVIGFAGDGDAYAEGLDHLIFAAKRNSDITMIIHNNRVFALTTGQFTPTSPVGFRGRSTPMGAPEEPFNPILLMLASGATFVARCFAGNLGHMKEVFKRALLHRGFAFIDVLQPCLSFYDLFDFYREHVYELESVDHDPSDFSRAIEVAREWNYEGEDDARIAIGIFYETRKPTYEELVLKGRKIEGGVPPIEELLEEKK